MRLIQLISGNGEGGTDQVAFCLGQGLRAAGHEVVYAADPGFLCRYGLQESYQAAWPIESFRRLSPGKLLRFNQRARGADLVLAHDSGARHFCLLAKLLGLRPPLWFMRHCLCGTTRAGGVQLHRLLVAQQVAVSDAVQLSLINSGFPPNRVTRIYGGIDLERFRRRDPARIEELRRRFFDPLPPDTLVLGMVARINFGPRWRVTQQNPKGYDVLFAALARTAFRYRVLVLGPNAPTHVEAVRQLAAYHGVDPTQLRFAGFVHEPADYYPLMDINILPSRAEGLGLTLIESMAAGVAAVGTRSGGIVEIISHGQTGLLFEAGNPADLAAQLTRLADEPALRHVLAQRGQAAVSARFNAELFVAAFCDRVAQLLGSSCCPQITGAHC